MSKRLRYTIETLLVNALILSTLYQLVVYLANRRFWRLSSAYFAKRLTRSIPWKVVLWRWSCCRKPGSMPLWWI